jgi:hypothetical protein
VIGSDCSIFCCATTLPSTGAAAADTAHVVEGERREAQSVVLEVELDAAWQAGTEFAEVFNVFFSAVSAPHHLKPETCFSHSSLATRHLRVDIRHALLFQFDGKSACS